MVKLALRLAGLAALIVLWAVVLWFAVRPDLATLSPIGLLVLHGVPPVLTWAAGWGSLRVLRARQATRVRIAEDAERQREAQAAAAAHQQQREALARRRTALPVLAAAIAIDGERDAVEVLAPINDAIVVLPPVDGGGLETSGDPVVADLLRVVERVLCETLAVCPAAVALPVRIACPAELADQRMIDCVRTVMSSGWDARTVDASDPGLGPAVSIACAVGDEHPVDALFAALDCDAPLPGMILLAVDSPRLRDVHGTDDAAGSTDASGGHRRWHGAPAQAVIAFVVGSPRLGELLACVESSDDAGVFSLDGAADGAMRPFWDAGHVLPATLGGLAALDPDVRADLAAAIPVGMLHRAEAVQFESRPGRVGALAAVVRRLLECGLVNAGQSPMPGLEAAAPERDSGSSQDAAEPPPTCDWLVHNAGGIDVAGERLAAVSLAMHQLRIDLNPIDEATNFPASLGDLGCALPLAMLAQAASKAAETAAPACWAHFVGAGSLRIGFLTPGHRPLSAGALGVAVGAVA